MPNIIHQRSSRHQAIWSQTHIKLYPSAVFRTSSHLVTNTCQTSIKSLGHQAIWSQTHIKQYPPTVYRTASHLVTNTHQTVSTNSLQDIKPSGHKCTPKSIHQQSTGHQAIQQSASCAPTGDREASCLNSDVYMNWQLTEATAFTYPSTLA